jgi:hypothetical protein
VRIDKVVFSATQPFAEAFWNLQSRVWRTKLNVEPVCLLFGDKRTLSQEYGTVIEMAVNPKIPLLIQITWSKFWWVTNEPERTCLIGDIDLLPLSTHWFTTNLSGVSDDAYVHLDADGITQLAGTASWCGLEPGQVVKDLGCPTNLPGHYHCGKGRILDIGLERAGSLDDELAHIVDSGLYRNSRAFREDDPIEQHNLWCAEELRSTKAIRRQIEKRAVTLHPFSLRHGINRIDGDRLDKSVYDSGRYVCDESRLRSGGYVDLHAARPFAYATESERANRVKATEDALSMAGML